MFMTAAPDTIITDPDGPGNKPHPRRPMSFFWRALFFSASLLLVSDGSGAFETTPASAETDWLTASSAFKLELHALAAEALMLQLRTPPLPSDSPDPAADAYLLLQAGGRLSDSLRTANALLSMMEIAGHSDRGHRVREVLLLWLDSSRRSLADHLRYSASSSADASPGPRTAVFLEELRIVWRRLDRAYADLESVVGAA